MVVDITVSEIWSSTTDSYVFVRLSFGLPGLTVGDTKERYLVADSSATYFGLAIALNAGLTDSLRPFL